jgi:hypothetical protein
MTDSTRPYLRRIIWPVILLVVLLASCASWSTPTPPLGADSPPAGQGGHFVLLRRIGDIPGFGTG